MESIQTNKLLLAEKGLFYLWYVLYKLHDNHKTSRAEEQNVRKEETEKHIIENYQAKMTERNTREKKQWRYRSTSKQKIKWQY